MTIRLESGNAHLRAIPGECPYCHRSITPGYVSYNISAHFLEVIFSCPSDYCGKAYVASYTDTAYENYNLHHCSSGTFKSIGFDPEIETISPMFLKIYNQAYHAEQNDLLEICGVGYRKALEFLLKDYLVVKFPADAQSIKDKLLASCVKEFVNDPKVKSVAQRAVWLGNDQTHYTQKWADKDLDDFKTLIRVTVHWISMELLTSSYQESMQK